MYLSVCLCLSVCFYVSLVILFIHQHTLAFLIKIFLSSLLLLYSFNILGHLSQSVSPSKFVWKHFCCDMITRSNAFYLTAFKFCTIILHNKRKNPIDFQITPFCLSVCLSTSQFATISIQHCQREIIQFESQICIKCVHILCVWCLKFFLFFFNENSTCKIYLILKASFLM